MPDRVLVTGGAGFIGSHLVNEIIKQGREVVILDNLSTGSKTNLIWKGNPNFTFFKGDLLEREDVQRAIEGCDVVFHLGANANVRIGAFNSKIDFEQNVIGTYNLLEAIRKSRSCKKLVTASTSTVYGEADILPTPDDHNAKPISLYGASKLAAEALISGFSHMFAFKSAVLRLANVVGPGSNHGIIFDFVRKLRTDPGVLEILGDGEQTKSYLHVSDCVSAFLVAEGALSNEMKCYNVGSDDQIDVVTIARIVAEEMRLDGVKFRFLDTLEGKGWKGDVTAMILDCSKIKALGWRSKFTSGEAIRLAVRALCDQIVVLNSTS